MGVEIDFNLADVFSYESLVHAVAGAMGSVTAMTVFFPLDTARLRLQVDEKRKARSTPAVLTEIIREEGILAPYRGWFPVICSLCCSNFVYFYCFNSLKVVWVKGQRSTPGRDLLMGIVAGVVNVLMTTPLWVVNTRLKLQGAKFRNTDIRPTHYAGILDAFRQIVRAEGVLALWNGTLPSLLLVLNPAVQFMIYEGLKRQLMRGAHRELLSLEVFVIGAVAKAVATTVTYPLQTVQSILRFGQHAQPQGRRLLGGLRSIVHLLSQRVGSSSSTLLACPASVCKITRQPSWTKHPETRLDTGAPPLSLSLSPAQEAGHPGTVQGAGGQAAADGPDRRPHVPALREDRRHHLQGHGLAEDRARPLTPRRDAGGDPGKTGGQVAGSDWWRAAPHQAVADGARTAMSGVWTGGGLTSFCLAHPPPYGS